MTSKKKVELQFLRENQYFHYWRLKMRWLNSILKWAKYDIFIIKFCVFLQKMKFQTMPENPNTVVIPPNSKDLAARGLWKFCLWNAHNVQMRYAQGFQNKNIEWAGCFSLGGCPLPLIEGSLLCQIRPYVIFW